MPGSVPQPKIVKTRAVVIDPVDIVGQAPTRIIRKPIVLDRVPLSDTTIWRMVRAGTFPKPINLSPGAIGWVESDVDAWIAARIAESRR